MCRTATGAASELVLMLMKDLLLRNLGRIFAMLGCTTIVTACYGTPYSIYNEDIYGRVTDAESGNPIPDISVRITDATSASSKSPCPYGRDLLRQDGQRRKILQPHCEQERQCGHRGVQGCGRQAERQLPAEAGDD